jgi:hypothetical protein
MSALRKARGKGYDAGFRAGVEAAADYLEQFNRVLDHPYRIDDCVLGKFNVSALRTPRRNPFYCRACRRVRAS